MLDHGVRQTHAALVIGYQQLGARDHGGGFVIMCGGEERILSRQARMHGVHQGLAERFQRGFGKTGADIQACRVLRRQHLAIGRGYADPAFGIQRSHDGGDEGLNRPGHRLECPWPECLGGRLFGRGQAGCLDPMGLHGISWDITASHTKNRYF